MAHNCEHEDEWKEYIKFKEQVVSHIKSKEALNGITKETITELKKEITKLNSKIDKLLFIFMTAFITLVISIIIRT
jgi:hypothetical protein